MTHQDSGSATRRRLAQLLLPVVTLGLLAPAAARADAPKPQLKFSIGAEIEGLIWVQAMTKTNGKPYALLEKSEWVPSPSRDGKLGAVGKTGKYGLPYITLEFDQVFNLGGGRASAMQATGEIVTAPYDATIAGITAMLASIKTLCANRPKGRMTFGPSADGWGATAIVRPSRWCLGSGAPQVNITVAASKLLGSGNAAVWTTLAGSDAQAKLGTAAAAIANDLTAGGAPLAAYANRKTEVGLWILAWMSRLASDANAGNGLAKDAFGCTMKMKIDPVSSGLDTAAGTAVAALPPTGPIALKAKAAVDAAGSAVTFNTGIMNLLKADQAVATERPLATRIVGGSSTVAGAIAPIIESRSGSTKLNTEFKKAYLSVIRGGDPATEAATFYNAAVKSLVE